jgi:hypothetical protein
MSSWAKFIAFSKKNPVVRALALRFIGAPSVSSCLCARCFFDRECRGCSCPCGKLAQSCVRALFLPFWRNVFSLAFLRVCPCSISRETMNVFICFVAACIPSHQGAESVDILQLIPLYVTVGGGAVMAAAYTLRLANGTTVV